MKKNETILFELCSTEKSMYEDKYGNRRNTAKSLSLPSKATMLYEDNDGDSYIRNIRYVKSQKSIFTQQYGLPENQPILPTAGSAFCIQQPDAAA